MDYDVTVIGAGVVGLATARKLSESYGSLLIVDKIDFTISLKNGMYS